jgi:hypothetical protein
MDETESKPVCELQCPLYFYDTVIVQGHKSASFITTAQPPQQQLDKKGYYGGFCVAILRQMQLVILLNARDYTTALGTPLQFNAL